MENKELMETIVRDFKGVWIPKEVWLDTDLNALDKIILVEIDSLDSGERGCFASNKYLAEFCQCSESKVSRSISKLTKLGYVSVKSFNGRCRVLKSLLKNVQGSLGKKARQTCKQDSLGNNPRQPRQKAEADSAKKQAINIDNNIDNNIDIKKEINKERKEKSSDHFLQNDRVSLNADKKENLDLEKNQVSGDIHSINVKESNSSNKRLNEEFNQVWDLYPKKQGKKPAQAAFYRARRNGTPLESIISGIKSYLDYIAAKKISQEYVKQGSTFFNQEAWNDDWTVKNEKYKFKPGYSFYNSKPNYDIEAYERSSREIFEAYPSGDNERRSEFDQFINPKFNNPIIDSEEEDE